VLHAAGDRARIFAFSAENTAGVKIPRATRMLRRSIWEATSLRRTLGAAISSRLTSFLQRLIDPHSPVNVSPCKGPSLP